MTKIDWSDLENVFWKWDVERYQRYVDLFHKNLSEKINQLAKSKANEIADKYPQAKLEKIK